jgi:hypothetical protein
MKTYNSFVLRTWSVREHPGSERCVVDIEHMQTGDSARFANLDAVLAWLSAACGASKTGAELRPGRGGRKDHEV